MEAEAVLPWVLESTIKELLEGHLPIPTGLPGWPKEDEAATLLLIKYCLWGGGSTVSAVWPSETCTILGEAERRGSGGLDYDATSLARLRPESTAFSTTSTATSANIGSIPGSPWGSTLLDYFSTTAVSAEGLEHPEGARAVWECFLRLWL